MKVIPCAKLLVMLRVNLQNHGSNTKWNLPSVGILGKGVGVLEFVKECYIEVVELISWSKNNQ